jgi:hypothetical protein
MLEAQSSALAASLRRSVDDRISDPERLVETCLAGTYEVPVDSDVLITYDTRLRGAAEMAGLRTSAPGHG